MSRDEADEIYLDDTDHKFLTLPISNPTPRPAFCEDYVLGLDFALKIDDENVFHNGHPHRNPVLFGDDGCESSSMYVRYSDGIIPRHGGPFIGLRVVGSETQDPILMGAHFSLYFGSWATINVKLLNKGVGSFGGLIVARPCIFRSRIRLLTIDRDRDPQVVDKSGFVKLTRSVVAVPAYASFIIGAKLYDDYGQLFCCGKIAFPAKESGEETRIISYKGVDTLEVSVRWECHS